MDQAREELQQAMDEGCEATERWTHFLRGKGKELKTKPKTKTKPSTKTKTKTKTKP